LHWNYRQIFKRPLITFVIFFGLTLGGPVIFAHLSSILIGKTDIFL